MDFGFVTNLKFIAKRKFSQFKFNKIIFNTMQKDLINEGLYCNEC